MSEHEHAHMDMDTQPREGTELRRIVSQVLAEVQTQKGIEFSFYAKDDPKNPSIRVDVADNRVTGNDELDAALDTMNVELAKHGLKLGDHIQIGFEGAESADGFEVVEA